MAVVRRLSTICGRSNSLFNFTDLLPYMSEYAAQADLMQYGNDGHYNSFGHRVAAQAIARMLWDRRMLDPKRFRHEPSTEPHLTR